MAGLISLHESSQNKQYSTNQTSCSKVLVLIPYAFSRKYISVSTFLDIATSLFRRDYLLLSLGTSDSQEITVLYCILFSLKQHKVCGTIYTS